MKVFIALFKLKMLEVQTAICCHRLQSGLVLRTTLISMLSGFQRTWQVGVRLEMQLHFVKNDREPSGAYKS